MNPALLKQSMEARLAINHFSPKQRRVANLEKQ
jgi:hypothetical protein